MTPHIVLNFNLSQEGNQGGDARLTSGTEALPTPGAAIAGMQAAAHVTAGLPSPLAAGGAAAADAVLTGLPTPHEQDAGYSASLSGGGLPSPLDFLGALGSTDTANASRVPTPADFPAQSSAHENQVSPPSPEHLSVPEGVHGQAAQPGEAPPADPERSVPRGKK